MVIDGDHKHVMVYIIISQMLGEINGTYFSTLVDDGGMV